MSAHPQQHLPEFFELEKVIRTIVHTRGLLDQVRIRGRMTSPFGLQENFLAWGVIVYNRKTGESDFATGGDSGALIFHDKVSIGLLFGGSMGDFDHSVLGRVSSDITFFTPITELEEKLHFSMPQIADWPAH